ncbi:MAG: hypothetical protein FD123_779 [Bacteroidetes bacterium]|nr:MAG: hypothetical protein FD123_779 [Bacteroidota bacterium]
MKTISVLKDFSDIPGLRNCSISDYSGEEFYHKVLNKKFKETYEKGEKLLVDLDNTEGYASSFLDEAFGNLIYDFTLDVVKKSVEIKSDQEPHWKEMIEKESYVQWEERRRKNEHPIVTTNHEPWFRLISNELKQSVWERPSNAV